MKFLRFPRVSPFPRAVSGERFMDVSSCDKNISSWIKKKHHSLCRFISCVPLFLFYLWTWAIFSVDCLKVERLDYLKNHFYSQRFIWQSDKMFHGLSNPQ